MGVLLLLASFMVRKEDNLTSRYALYAATTYASDGLNNSQLAAVTMVLGIIFLVIGILSLICMTFSGSKFAIFILILCGVVSLIFPLLGILILCGASLESKRCAKGNSTNAGSLFATLILCVFGLSSLIMLFRLNGRVNISSSVNSFEGYAINYFSSFIKNETELVKYKKVLTTSYLFILLTLIPAVIDLLTAAICISNPMKNIENRKKVKTVSTLMWVLFTGLYALYIYKILTINVVADGSTEVAYKGLISMANDISNRDLYPLIMLFVGPALYYLSLKKY